MKRKFDLSKMWVGWGDMDHEVEGGISKGLKYFRTKSAAKQYYSNLDNLVAITRADATSFTEGEGL